MAEPTRPADTWNARFAGEAYVFGTEPNAFLKAETHRLKRGDYVLAVADGEGRNGVHLASLDLRVHAVDASSEAIAKSRRLAAERGVTLEWEQADLTTWTWPQARYDAVAAIFIQFAPPPLRARLFEAMKSALKPGGLILLEGYRPEQVDYRTGGPPTRENMYDETILRRAFADFEIVSLRAYDAEIHEGAGHRGMSALIDLIAHKPA